MLDPFSGSGTTAAVCVQTGRRFIAGDIRMSQCELTRLRVRETQPVLEFAKRRRRANELSTTESLCREM